MPAVIRPRQKPAGRRAYMARNDRREALLEVAAGVVERAGWPALTMMAVAEAANVSRQLVYQHFDSVDTLMADTMSHLFSSRYARIRAGVERGPADLSELVHIVEQQTFHDSPERVRALWQILTVTEAESPETRRMGRRLRHLLIKLWAPFVQQRLGLDAAQARALSWMLNMAFWGAHQLVEDGELSRRAASDLFIILLQRLETSAPRAAARLARVADRPAARPRTTTRRPSGAPDGTTPR